MSVNKSVLALLRRSNAVSSMLCSRNYNRQLTAAFHKEYANKAATKPDWNRAVAEAEKIVGYPNSFLSLRWLLNDEIANIAVHLRRLAGSNHPLLKTAKNLMYNGHNNLQTWGLIVLLVSKAAGQVNIDDLEIDKAAGILHSQRALAEVTEMIRTSHIVHQGLLNIERDAYPDPRQLDDMTFGNKIALLSGDYLLGKACAELANLRNQELVELMSSSVKDLAEAEYIGRRDKQDNPLPSVPSKDCIGYALEEWTMRNVLSTGALLGKSCKGTLKLAGYDKDMQEQGYEFGEHLALAWQACLDLSPFIINDRSSQFSVCSAPVMFHIEHDPSILSEIDKGLGSVHEINYPKIYDLVYDGPGVELTKKLQREHSQRALEVLSIFNESDARTAMENIITAMSDF